MAIPVKLPVFEGPLDLLMHLIEKNKIDIYDIPIAEITDQYLDYVHQMDREDLDVTSEFLVMAATLLDIKSRMLLPREKDEETGEEEGDPREELVRRLLEYKMYKYLSEELAVCREQAGVRYFRAQNLPKEVLNYRPPINYDELLKGTDLRKLQKVFGEVLRRKKSRRDPIRSGFGKIKREEISIDNKTLYVRAYLQVHPHTDFRALLESQESREEVIVTFLILLELMKTQKVHIVQDTIGGKILVEAGAGDTDSNEEMNPSGAAKSSKETDSREEADSSHETEISGESDSFEETDASGETPKMVYSSANEETASSNTVSEKISSGNAANNHSSDTSENAASSEVTEETLSSDAPAAASSDTDSEKISSGATAGSDSVETAENADVENSETAIADGETLSSAEDSSVTEETENQLIRKENESSAFSDIRPDSDAEMTKSQDLNSTLIGTAAQVSLPLTAFNRMELVSSPMAVPAVMMSPNLPNPEDTLSDYFAAQSPLNASFEAPPSAGSTESEAGESPQDETLGAGSASEHFSAHLWWGVPRYKTAPLRTYTGLSTYSRVQPSSVWLRARMARLWARRFR